MLTTHVIPILSRAHCLWHHVDLPGNVKARDYKMANVIQSIKEDLQEFDIKVENDGLIDKS